MRFVEGFENFDRKMRAVDKAIREKCLDVIKDVSWDVANRAKDILTENRHVKTGNLRRSIKAEAHFESDTLIVGTTGTDVHYAPYVEALPDGGYLYRAFREVVPKSIDDIRKKLKEAFK